ncbi:MAG: M23 family metallopeptidase [Chloroflexi bacterium]|nr:M23 family metallopeptidase [Chloroflexota bacterium]
MVEGETVTQGQIIGTVGNSGSPASLDDPTATLTSCILNCGWGIITWASLCARCKRGIGLTRSCISGRNRKP